MKKKNKINMAITILVAALSTSTTTLSAPGETSTMLMSSPVRGTYSTSLLSSLNTYIGMYKAKKYHIYDGEFQVRPTLEIRKEASHYPYGYTVKINFPCASKNGPTIFSINYSGDQVELFRKGTGQCTIAENFEIYMFSQIDMVDGILSNQKISLHTGIFNPTFRNGYIEFEPDTTSP